MQVRMRPGAGFVVGLSLVATTAGRYEGPT